MPSAASFPCSACQSSSWPTIAAACRPIMAGRTSPSSWPRSPCRRSRGVSTRSTSVVPIDQVRRDNLETHNAQFGTATSRYKSMWPRNQGVGPGGGLSVGPGGGMSVGPGGGLSVGPGGGLSVGPGGGLSIGPGGGLSVAPNGGLSVLSGQDTYRSVIPPWHIFVQELEKRRMQQFADMIRQHISYVCQGRF